MSLGRKALKEFKDTPIATIISLVVALVMITSMVRGCIKDKKDDKWKSTYEKQLAEIPDDFTKIVSVEMAGLEAKVKGYAETKDEVVLAEAVRRIIASHGNDKRAVSDAYKKAIYAGLAACYIYEINDAPDEFGSNFFMTQEDFRPGTVNVKGSSDLLTVEEKTNINLCVDSYVEKLKSAKPMKELLDRAVQEEVCWFLLQHDKSRIGSVTEPLSLQVERSTSFGMKTEDMEPYAKVGAIVGYIGDELFRHAGGF